jgi:MoaA/NifB/PqqE/SkfB family radical SAM enzyme
MKEKKIISIAPSFNCKLKCEGCYLTSNVTKEMRDAVRTENYWMALIDEAAARGYDEFCITMNPFPGVVKETTKYLKKAKAKGLITNVTTVFQLVSELDNEFYANVDTLTLSVDDLHDIDLPIISYMLDVFTIQPFTIGLEGPNGISDYIRYIDEVANILETLTEYNVSLNYNLLWTPKVFEYVLDCKEKGYIKERWNHNQSTVQHLFYKPISLYESDEWFWEHFERVMEEVPEIDILGTKPWSICDVSMKNHMGSGLCPGYEHQMVDFDPMGYARRCPENPVAYDATSIGKAVKFLSKGTPCQTEKCNCIFN